MEGKKDGRDSEGKRPGGVGSPAPTVFGGSGDQSYLNTKWTSNPMQNKNSAHLENDIIGFTYYQGGSNISRKVLKSHYIEMMAIDRNRCLSDAQGGICATRNQQLS